MLEIKHPIQFINGSSHSVKKSFLSGDKCEQGQLQKEENVFNLAFRYGDLQLPQYERHLMYALIKYNIILL